MSRHRPRRVGLAIVGGGRIGTFRGQIAAQYPEVDWIGVAEIKPERALESGRKMSADFVTEDFKELLARPEVTAAIIATDEPLHVAPILAAVDRGLSLLIEKPLASDLAESERVLMAIRSSKVDAVVGYSQRFRRRWLTIKDRIQSGAIGDVSLVSSQTLMNRLVALDKFRQAADASAITPMLIAGTHPLDLTLWFLEGKTAVRAWARSIHKVFGPMNGGTDATVGVIEMSDGSIVNISISWALPVSWPSAVDSLQMSIVGTQGVLAIDDSHSDVVMAVSAAQGEGYAPDATRRVDFLGGYLAGDVALGQLRGPLHDETFAWLNRLSLGLDSHHATAEEAHIRLMLTKALDLSARLGSVVELPLTSENMRFLA